MESIGRNGKVFRGKFAEIAMKIGIAKAPEEPFEKPAKKIGKKPTKKNRQKTSTNKKS